MKKLLFASVFFLFCLTIFAQTPVTDYRIANSTPATFSTNLPVGSKIYQVDTRQYWVVVTALASGGTLADAKTAGNVKELGSITLGTVGTETIKVRTTTLGEDAVGSQQIELPKAETGKAGLMTGAMYDKLFSPTASETGKLTVESFEQAAVSSTFTLTGTPKVGMSISVSLNGKELPLTVAGPPAKTGYSISGTTLTIDLPTVQYDQVSVTYMR